MGPEFAIFLGTYSRVHAETLREMALASWLLAPIRAPRALPLLPGAMDDAMTRKGTATSAPSTVSSAKRKSPSYDIGTSTTTDDGDVINPFTIASRAVTAPPSTSYRSSNPEPTTLPPGDYHLPDDASLLRYEPNALACTRDEYDELWRISHSVEPTPNPMNRHVNLLRKQATFGATYKFGAQVSQRVDLPRSKWPTLVKRCVEDSVARIENKSGARDSYAAAVAAHVNWYPDGRAGMGRHADAEPDLIPGAPIFSYSFSSANAHGLPRLFDVYEAGAKKPIASVPLGHGDVLVMCGSMQDTYEHGVRSTSRKAYASESRINVTVRAFKPGSDAVSTRE